MQAKKEFTLHHIGDIYFILPDSPDDFPTNDFMLTTNETGAILWQQLQQQTTMENLTAYFQSVYEIDKAAATEDINYFLQGLQKIGALTEK